MTDDKKTEMLMPDEDHERFPKLSLVVLEADEAHFVETGELKLYHRLHCHLAGEPEVILQTAFNGDLNQFMRTVIYQRVPLTKGYLTHHLLLGFPAPEGSSKILHSYAFTQQELEYEFLLLLYETYFPGSKIKRRITFTLQDQRLSLVADIYQGVTMIPGLQKRTIVAFWQNLYIPEQQVAMMRKLGVWFPNQVREAIDAQKRALHGRLFGQRPAKTGPSPQMNHE